MPPPLALVLTLLFIAFLFRREIRQDYKPSQAVWIPCIWLLILGSRSVTEWLNLGSRLPGSDISEGSPLDRTVFFVLIIAGLAVLLRRRVWSKVFRYNRWLTLFFLYCGISILWSDFPLVAFKRWTKGIGDPIMMLVILTEREPLKALERVLMTCAYVLIPLSILFIKYYPTLGRTYSEWTGAAAYTGVTTNKNLLGFVLMVSGLFLVWRLTVRWRRDGQSGKWVDDIGIPILLLLMVGWLFQMADSKTSLMGLILGVLVFAALGRRNVRRHIVGYLIAGIATFVLLQVSFNITDILITSAGRDATLTGRTELWDVVLHTDPRPVLGHGFESFWLGDRLKKLQDLWYFRPTQSHNGYIEIYLNLGWMGLLILVGVIVSCFLKLRELLTSSSEMTERVMFGRFGLAFLAMYLVYNYTEAAFKSLHFLFVLFLLFAIKYPWSEVKIAHSWPADFPQSNQKLLNMTDAREMTSAR